MDDYMKQKTLLLVKYKYCKSIDQVSFHFFCELYAVICLMLGFLDSLKLEYCVPEYAEISVVSIVFVLSSKNYQGAEIWDRTQNVPEYNISLKLRKLILQN